MGSSVVFLFLSLFFTFELATCHHGDHQYYHNDHKWIQFVSQIHSFWKSDTSVTPSVTENNSDNPLITKVLEKVESSVEVYNPQPTVGYIQNGTTYDDVKTTFKMSLAAIISIPIVCIIVLICCCYCICKCCCGMCASEQKGVVINPIVMQAPPPANPQPTQIIVQQPIYQNMQRPEEMQHFPMPHQQWGQQPPQFQQNPQFQQPLPPQYFPKDGIDNPNFYPATAPPQYAQDKY